MKKAILILFLLGISFPNYSQMFQKITNQPLVTEQGFGSGCAWGDYNNDGKLDMIVTSYNDFGATTYPLLYKNMGNGNFQIASDNTIMTNSLNQTLACAWGDYNYDGRMDLYIATGLNQPDLLYKNMGGGNFTRITNCVPLVNGHSGGVNWTDYNKDGYLDILSVQHGTNLLYKGLPNGDFQQVTTGPIVTDNGLHRRAVWGDYNNDKYPDLFVANGDFQNDNLYLNNKNGTFTKITTGPVVTSGGYGSGCAWGDYNNDGWLDLFVANSGKNFLYKNNQNGTFTKITSGAIANDEDNSFGCNWGDYDNDGDLDMFVANNYGQKNALYRNDGNDNFTRMNGEAVSTDNSSSVGSVWGDYNNDKYPDLFVANGDFQNDNLYLNNKNGTFTKITTGPVVTSGGYGSGCAWGDYNNDGWLDLFVANSGKNFLYKNNQNGTFTKITSGAIANDEDNSFGCNWGDYDNDGDLDMFVANNYGQKNALYRNDGNDNFTRMNGEAVSTDNSSSVGSAWGDYNNDGKLDLFVVNQGNGSQGENDFLFKNTGASNWYLMLKFWGGGIGTKVKIRIGNYVAIREVSGGNGCSSQDMPWIHFGLGFLADNPVSAADSVIVDWHDGTTEILTNVSLNQELDFFGVVPVQQISSEVPTVYSLEQNYPNPFNPVTNINYSIVTGGEVKVTLFDISGKEVDVLVNGVQSPGKYSISYNASRLPSGVYFYRIQAEGFTDTKKMILVK